MPVENCRCITNNAYGF
ncbi:unnamed protein product [Victoria cruziana]